MGTAVQPGKTGIAGIGHEPVPLGRYLRWIASTCTDPQLAHRLTAIAQQFDRRPAPQRDNDAAPRPRPEGPLALRVVRSKMSDLEAAVHCASLPAPRRSALAAHGCGSPV